MERAPDLETEKKIHRMTDYCRTKVADYVPDPYYGGDVYKRQHVWL